MKKKFLTKAIFLFLPFVIIFLSLEIILGIFDREKLYDSNYQRFNFPVCSLVKIGLYRSDPVVFWKMRPNVKESWYMQESDDIINSRGLRGKEFSSQKPKNTFRIICLGDSHVFGWGVGLRYTWPYKLEKILEKTYSNMKFEVINGGTSGFSSYQTLQFLKTEGIYYSPNVITISHDHHNAELAELNADSAQKTVPSKLIKIHYYLARFRTYRLLREIIFQFEKRFIFKQKIPRVSKEEYAKNLSEIASIVKSRGSKVVFIDSLYFTDNTDLNEQYSPIMRDVAAKEGIPLVDLKNTWRSLNMKEYLLKDMSHPNEKGYDIIANEVCKSLRENGLIKIN